MLLGYIVTIALVVGEYVLLMKLPERTGYVHALFLTAILLAVAAMIGIVAWHRLAVQVRGAEAVGQLRHKWYYWPPAIVLGFLAIMFSLLPQVVVFNLLAQVVGDQQTYLMLAALAGGIIFTAISLKFYYWTD